MTQPDLVCVAVPGETSTVITADGTAHAVQIDENGRRAIWIQAEQARMMLNSGHHTCLLWREANPRLADVLGLLPRNQI
jgi:hypothetical protein